MPIGRPSEEEARKRVDDAIEIAKQSGLPVTKDLIVSIVKELAEQDAKRDAREINRIIGRVRDEILERGN